MNLKMIVLIICVGYGIWFSTIGGKQINEEHVLALYEQSGSAFMRADGKAYCDLISGDMSGKITSKVPSFLPPVAETLNKENLCASVDKFYQIKEQMEKVAGQDLYVNYSYTIKSISISADKKIATAEVQSEIRVGTERGALLVVQGHKIDKIKRSFGKAKFFQGEGEAIYLKRGTDHGFPARRGR